MKTLEQGNLNWWVGLQLGCPVCGARVELEAGDDIKVREVQEDASTKHQVHYVMCPTCGGEIWVEKASDRRERVRRR